MSLGPNASKPHIMMKFTVIWHLAIRQNLCFGQSILSFFWHERSWEKIWENWENFIFTNSHPLVNDLKKQLVMKDNLLTETRLEALSSAHQLESLRDTVTKMRTELMSVRSQNEKLQCIVVCRNSSGGQKSLNSSQNSLNNNKTDLENGTDDGACGSGSGRCVICLLKFIYSEKATQIWWNSPFDLTSNKWNTNLLGDFVKFLWSSQNIWTYLELLK